METFWSNKMIRDKLGVAKEIPLVESEVYVDDDHDPDIVCVLKWDTYGCEALKYKDGTMHAVVYNMDWATKDMRELEYFLAWALMEQ